MNDMHELITVEAFNRLVLLTAVVWLVVGVVIAGIRHARGAPGALRRGLVWALLGPVVLVLWKFYNWMVRVEPSSGYVGLHRVSVFAICALVFVGVGGALGFALARLRDRNPDGDA